MGRKIVVPHFCDYEPQNVDNMDPAHQKMLLRGYRTRWKCEDPFCAEEVWCYFRQWPPGYILQAMTASGIKSTGEADTVEVKTLEFDTQAEVNDYYAQKAKRFKDHLDRDEIYLRPPSDSEGILPESPDKV